MATPAAPAETILVVDDEPEVLALVRETLGVAGYTVLSTGDPREALRFARTRTAPIHLLLTDVVMPLMSGRQLSEELRIIRPDVKILFMSAYSVDTVEAYSIRLNPGEPFLAKPFTVAEILRTVRAALAYYAPVPRSRRP